MAFSRQTRDYLSAVTNHALLHDGVKSLIVGRMLHFNGGSVDFTTLTRAAEHTFSGEGWVTTATVARQWS